jgi:adenine deaminase
MDLYGFKKTNFVENNIHMSLASQNQITANLIDLHERKIYLVKMQWENKILVNVTKLGEEDGHYPYVLPGFIDAHVHIESSMLTPEHFGNQAVVHGTVGTVSDPHEIANVMGIAGVRFMVDNARKTPLKIMFGAPSCVPATSYETAGAELNATDIESMLDEGLVHYLSEVMNFPGVIQRHDTVMAKLEVALLRNIPIDGHAPGITGEDIGLYFNTGITTDHECFTLHEGLEKANAGINILIREGSAAKNYEALKSLLHSHPNQVMFCSDDKHPDDLSEGHINLLVKRALADGFDMFDVFRAACLNPVIHYRMPIGLCRVGDPADFIVIDHPIHCTILQTWIDGKCVWPDSESTNQEVTLIGGFNKFDRIGIMGNELIARPATQTIRCIEVLEGELITKEKIMPIKPGFQGFDLERDVLKLVVMSRYDQSPPAVAFIVGFGFKNGAIASSVAHDCHNIVAVGCDDESLQKAIALIIKHKGGICAVTDEYEEVIPLEIAGIMTSKSCKEISESYIKLNEITSSMGTSLKAPFMTLSFMSLLVIPELKLSDKGLFDGRVFSFVDSYC